MKLAKKILVSVLVLTVLVSGLALITSAEAPALSTAEIEDVLVHYSSPVYIVEDYESMRLRLDGVSTNYEDVKSTKAYAIDGYFDYASFKPETMKYSLVEENGNTALKIIGDSASAGKGHYVFSNFDDDEFVMSMRFKMGGEEYHGTDIYLKLKLVSVRESGNIEINGDSDGVRFFTVSGSGGDYNFGKLAYATYEDGYFNHYESADRATVEGFELKNDNWYKIDFVCNLAEGYYDLKITDEATSTEYAADRVSLPKTLKITEARLVYLDPADSSAERKNSVTYFDDVIAYQGSELRDVRDTNNIIGGYLRGLDALGKSSSTSVDDKLRIAEVYKTVMLGANPYVPEATIDEYAKVQEIVDGAEAFVNCAYAEKYLTYVNNMQTLSGYHARYDNVVESDEYDVFADEYDDLILEAGFDKSYGSSTYARVIADAKASVLAEKNNLAAIKMHSEAFVDLILGYDGDNTDYVYLKEQLEALSLFTKKDSTYKYAEERDLPDTAPYQTVADAVAVYDTLVAKKNKIETNVVAFETAMNNLPAFESVVVTRGFASILTNYNAAKTVYVDGEFCEGIDYTTYAEYIGKLAEINTLIDKFDDYAEYVNTRTAITEEFLELVNSATRSTYYVKMFNETELAKTYIPDSSKTYSATDKVAETEYAGYTEAVEAYNALLVKLEGYRQDAALYIAAVNNIQIDAAYTSLKSTVDAAKALKEKGSVMGITGVAEADKKFAEAEAKITYTEGSSATLIASVKELKETTDFARRRALISIAVNAKTGADDTISGVTDAKTELTAQIEAYDAEVKAANDMFAAANKNASDVVFTAGFNVIDIIKALFN